MSALLLSGHQPVYLPGIILFNKIALSDAFMFVGHVQMSPKSWQQRNRIALNGRELMLSVPVGGEFGQAIDDAPLIDFTWRRKHLGSIRQAYQKRPFFKTYFPDLEAIINEPFPTLGRLNRAIILKCCEWLSLSTPICDSRSSASGEDAPLISGHKNDMLIEMCRAMGADAYLSNEGSRVYVDEAYMRDQGVEHYWQIFEPPTYPQGGDAFMPNLSIIDLLFNTGPEAAAIVRSCGRISQDAPAAAQEECAP